MTLAEQVRLIIISEAYVANKDGVRLTMSALQRAAERIVKELQEIEG